jgi:hypothetical protein
VGIECKFFNREADGINAVFLYICKEFMVFLLQSQFFWQIVDREFLVRVSYMEIYNEDINDLLAPESRKLHVHENLEVGFA